MPNAFGRQWTCRVCGGATQPRRQYCDSGCKGAAMVRSKRQNAAEMAELMREYKPKRGQGCAQCRHGRPNPAAWNGYECAIEKANACLPHVPWRVVLFERKEGARA